MIQMSPKQQAELLMNELLLFAEKMLSEYGEFNPFGGYLNTEDKVVHVGIKLEKKHSVPQQKVAALIEFFKKVAAKRKAIVFALVTNVLLPREGGEKEDAVKFFLEHESGYCAEVFFCYKLADGIVEITDTVAQQGEWLFFNSGSLH